MIWWGGWDFMFFFFNQETWASQLDTYHLVIKHGMLESRPVTLMMSPLKPPFRGISSRPRLRTRLRVLVPKNEQFCPDLNEHPVLSHIELQSSWWRKSLSAILWPVEAFSWLTFKRSKLATWLKSPSCSYMFIHMHMLHIYILYNIYWFNSCCCPFWTRDGLSCNWVRR